MFDFYPIKFSAGKYHDDPVFLDHLRRIQSIVASPAPPSYQDLDRAALISQAGAAWTLTMHGYVNVTFRKNVLARLIINNIKDHVSIHVYESKELECWVIPSDVFFRNRDKYPSLPITDTKQLSYPSFSFNGTDVYVNYSETNSELILHIPKSYKIHNYSVISNTITLHDGQKQYSQVLKCKPGMMAMAIDQLELPR